jgi:hypothetical protein
VSSLEIQECIQKFPDWDDNEINNKNKHSLRSNTKGYGGNTHLPDSQNSDTTAPSGRELYHLQFLLQAAHPETFRYTLISTHTHSLTESIAFVKTTTVIYSTSFGNEENKFTFLDTQTITLPTMLCNSETRSYFEG